MVMASAGLHRGEGRPCLYSKRYCRNLQKMPDAWRAASSGDILEEHASRCAGGRERGRDRKEGGKERKEGGKEDTTNVMREVDGNISAGDSKDKWRCVEAFVEA